MWFNRGLHVPPGGRCSCMECNCPRSLFVAKVAIHPNRLCRTFQSDRIVRRPAGWRPGGDVGRYSAVLNRAMRNMGTGDRMGTKRFWSNSWEQGKKRMKRFDLLAGPRTSEVDVILSQSFGRHLLRSHLVQFSFFAPPSSWLLEPRRRLVPARL